MLADERVAVGIVMTHSEHRLLCSRVPQGILPERIELCKDTIGEINQGVFELWIENID